MRNITYIDIGNNEIGECRYVKPKEDCTNCGELHEVKYGYNVSPDGTKTPSKVIGYVNCGNGKIYLVSIQGKRI